MTAKITFLYDLIKGFTKPLHFQSYTIISNTLPPLGSSTYTYNLFVLMDHK